MLGSIIGAVGNIAGSIIGGNAAKDAAKEQANLQKRFAQMGVRWKVEDAKKAGIHPLYALGAQTHSYTPTSIGDAGLGAGIAAAGQDIGRAIDSTRTAPEKLDALGRTAAALELERAGLQNDLLRAQIAETTSRSTQPAFPSVVDPYVIPGQAQSGVKNVPLERIMSAHNHPFAEAGPVSDVGFSRTYTGGLAPVYSSDAKQRLEDDYLGMLAWNVRNRVIPSLSLGAWGPRPPGHEGFYDPLLQEWVSWH